MFFNLFGQFNLAEVVYIAIKRLGKIDHFMVQKIDPMGFFPVVAQGDFA